MAQQVKTFHFGGSRPSRLDHFLVTRMPQMSRSRLQRLIKAGEVTVDREIVKKTGFKLENGARIHLVIPENVPSTLIPEEIPLDIIYEDENILVVNKPAGMVVHPSIGHDSGTLVHAALAHAPDLEGVGGEKRPGVVHRLDKHTSGIILLAKNDATHKHLQEQFSSREVDKSYTALVDGAPPTPVGRVEATIGRDPSHRQRMAIVPEHKGRQAISEYSTIEKYAKHTILEIHPITGRTHQIRVHMKFLKCPIAGDTVYGLQHSSVPLKRHFLHAKRLSIRLRNNRIATVFEAPLAPELLAILDQLR